VANARLFLPVSSLVFIVGGYFTQNIYALPMGFLAGHIMGFIVLAYKVPYDFQPRLDVRDPDVRRILINSFKLTGSGLITKLRGPILQYFGSLLGEGAIAATTMAIKLCAPVHEAALMGVRMIVFSKASQEAGRGNLVRLADIYNYSLSAVLLGVVPVAVWVTFNGHTLVRVVFERGEFTQAMSMLVTLALYGAAPTIVFHGLVQLLSNSFYALQRISIPLYVLPAGTVIFFIASKLLSSAYGIFGLTLASSIVAGIMTLTLSIALQFALPYFSAVNVIIRLAKYTAIAVLFGYAGTYLTDYLELTGIMRLATTLSVQFLAYLVALTAIRDRTLVRVWRSVNRELLQKA
jgi:putative peptidoglycan lipid II flippase